MALALDRTAELLDVHVAGYTYSARFPTTDPQADMAGGGDAFVAKLDRRLSARAIDAGTGLPGD